MSLIDLKVPSIGESITEVTLSKWLKPDGAIVAVDEALCEFESDKATLEFPSEANGKLIHIAKEGDDLPIGALVAQLDTSFTSSGLEKKEEMEAKHPPAVEGKSPAPGQESHIQTSPVAARILAESNLKAENVLGTGPFGKITKTDALEALARKEKAQLEAIPRVESPKSQAIPGARNQRRVKLSRMRRTIAKRLVSAQNETAMLTTFNEVDMSAIMELRNTYNEAFQKKYGIKIGFMSVFAKACSTVLLQMPEVNARLDGEDLIYHDYVDISLAISTPNGLVVPPIRNVESLKLHEFELQLKNLAEKARTGKLSMDEMTGGTFTITNGGVFGSMMSTPIINEPQSAILGMHNIKERAVVINGKIEIRPMMYLALSYDHRVIDGSSSVTFLVRLIELLEDPMKLFLEI
jgi:2-oxoglutarate dehydrogenase E2 component (dihydrolipoamide succinyltransferase)